MAIVLVYNKGILVAKTCRGLLGKATLDKNSPNTSNVANTEKKKMDIGNAIAMGNL